MKFVTIVKPGPAPPPVDLIRSAEEWVDGKLSDGTFECSLLGSRLLDRVSTSVGTTTPHH